LNAHWANKPYPQTAITASVAKSYLECPFSIVAHDFTEAVAILVYRVELTLGRVTSTVVFILFIAFLVTAKRIGMGLATS